MIKKSVKNKQLKTFQRFINGLKRVVKAETLEIAERKFDKLLHNK